MSGGRLHSLWQHTLGPMAHGPWNQLSLSVRLASDENQVTGPINRYGVENVVNVRIWQTGIAESTNHVVLGYNAWGSPRLTWEDEMPR